MLGEEVLGLLAAKVNIRGREWSEPADWGGVNVNEVAVGLGSVWRGGCVLVVGVKLGYAELGVSGYVIEKGPGVWVRCEGWTYSLSPGKLLVSSRNDVRLVNLVSIDVERGLAVLGEAFSIATAYAFESVLNAVGEEGSISAFKAVADFPSVCGVVGVLI